MQVVGGSVDGTVRQFDIRMGMMFTDTTHDSVTGIAISHDGNCVLASCLDHSMKLLDKASGELLATYTGEAVPLIKSTLHIIWCGKLPLALAALQKQAPKAQPGMHCCCKLVLPCVDELAVSRASAFAVP